MSQHVERLLRELDAEWRWPGTDKIRLRIIGSAALMLQTPFARGTKDSDVLETVSITAEVRERHFSIEILDVVDVVVSKLKRFGPNEVVDIRAMIELKRVPHAVLVQRFQAAVDFNEFLGDQIPRDLRNLNKVERDFLFVDETVLDLPSWMGG